MKVKDLIAAQPRGIFSDDAVLRGCLIAYNCRSGKSIFNTKKNKPEYIAQFYEWDVVTIWADCLHQRGYGFGDYFKPVTKCYIREPEVENA